MLCVLGATLAPSIGAQVAPNADWRTLRTSHFTVWFARELEPAARQAAATAETAYARLSRQLVPPRGPIDLVVSDDVDFANGITTPFPSNRIIIYLHPPLDVLSLRYYNDWLELVISHELTHVFHLDRTAGWWGVGQKVLGRAPFLFPNLYDPGWITEGLATYFESALTGTGRVAGSYERMVVESAVQRGVRLPYGDWSLATTRYPYGDIAYGHGSLFFDYLADTHGDSSIGQFVERSSRAVFPFTENRVAHGAFGESFADAWKQWMDSLRASADTTGSPLPGWRDLTHDGRLAVYPRWLDGRTLVWAGSAGDASPAAYRTDTAGAIQRLRRRNEGEINAPTRTGALVYPQLDFVDAYHVRSDLYRDDSTGTTRLTTAARLSEPDVRADGRIVAVRFAPLVTQLVLIDSAARSLAELTSATIDTGWAEPRWSPSGDRIAVTRWTRGGYADIVVLDTIGHVIATLTHDRAFDSSPSWSPDGRTILFTSDRTGIADIYSAPADGSGAPVRLSHATTGLFYPSPSPDGMQLAASRWDVDGWHIGLAPAGAASVDTPSATSVYADTTMPPATTFDGEVHGAAPWRTLPPHYWLPLIAFTSGNSLAFGGFTSGRDAVGRHAYAAQLLLDPADGETSGSFAWRYSGFGQPLVDFSLEQDWQRFSITGGTLRRRTRLADLLFTLTRPRVRTSTSFSLGGELEMRRYDTDPDSLLPTVDPYYASAPLYWSVVGAFSWTNAQLPPLAISPEDGVALGLTGDVRWLDADQHSRSQSAVGSVSVYKSLALGSFAHHVLAARLAGGIAGGVEPDAFDVGGTSGASVALVTGVNIGSRRTFAVRGFSSSAEHGIYAAAGSLEYRLPLSHQSVGAGFWPVFLDRLSIAGFADAGSAWGAGSSVGAESLPDGLLASVGGEVALDLGVLYDAPYHFRLGFAVPIVNRPSVPTSAVSVYASLGVAF